MDMGGGADRLDIRNWRYAGPVARAYELSRAPVAMIQGPVGGGKSTASARRCLRVATWQHPSPRDGVRKARIVVVCPTYRRAWDTVIPSWLKVFPRTLGDGLKGARGDPADHCFEMPLTLSRQPTRIRVEVLFRAVQDMDIEDFLRGFEFTALWLPEADTNGDLDQLLSLGSTRVGRYPEPDDRPDGASEAYAGIFGDANAPLIGSPFHRRMHLKQLPSEVRAPATDQLFVQPGGRSANAENLDNLRKINPNFYQAMTLQLDKVDVPRMIDNRPTYGRLGRAVHENFDPERHIAKVPLRIEPRLPVYIGVDKGSGTLHPAAVFYQRTPAGQWRALFEVFQPVGTLNTIEFAGELRRIWEAHFAPVLHREMGALICADPSLSARRAYDETTEALELQALAQIEVSLAPTNKADARRTALDKLFLKSVWGGEPAFLVDARCKGLIEALSGAWHYPRRGQVEGLTPVKNAHADIGEAAEYAPLSIEGTDPREGRFIRPDGQDDYSDPMAIYDD